MFVFLDSLSREILPLEITTQNSLFLWEKNDIN